MVCWLTEVVHRAGKLITHADGLSRSDHLPEPENYKEEEQAEYIQAMDESLANITEQMDQGLDTINLSRAQRADEYLQKVFEWKSEGKVFTKTELTKFEDRELKRYAEQLESIEEINGILYQKYIPNVPMAKQRMRSIIPEELREQAFFFSHSHPASGILEKLGHHTRQLRNSGGLE